MTKLTATLPDGTTTTRSTERNYTHICAIRITQLATGKAETWWAQWSGSENGAQKMAQSWHTCPAVKEGKIAVETKVIPI